MQIVEEPRKLPKNLVSPRFIGRNKQNYDDSSAFILSIFGNGLLVDRSSYSNRITTAYELIHDMLKFRHNFTWCRPEEFDILWKLFNKGNLYELDENHSFKYGDYTITQYSASKITIRKGNLWTSIYNIYAMSISHLDTIGKIDIWISKLKELKELIGLELNVSSPSMSAQALLTQLTFKLPSQFNRVRTLSPKQLELVNSTIHNTWMETTRLGTVESSISVDSIKAHLRALGKVPSISIESHLLSEKPRYTPDAVMGFYIIETTLPKAQHSIVPLRYKDKTTAPYGPRVQYVSKPTLDKMTEIKIPFKIHKAFELLPIGEITYPFKHFSIIVERIIDAFSERLYPLDLKMIMYKTTIGNMQHIHLSENQLEEIETPDDVIFETSAIFNPLIASTVYSIVNCDVYDALNSMEGSFYRRHDGVTCRKTIDDKRFRKEITGTTFILTSIIHDNPGNSYWRTMSYDHRDQSKLNLAIPNKFMGRRLAMNEPEIIGNMTTLYQTIVPTPDIRLPVNIRKVGDLLERSIMVPPLSVEDIPRLGPSQGLCFNPAEDMCMMY